MRRCLKSLQVRIARKNEFRPHWCERTLVFRPLFIASLSLPMLIGLASADDASVALVSRSTPLSPAESLESIVTSPEIRIELVASEPEVIDPVAARFDVKGRLWVVEMRDYPTGPVAGDGVSSTPEFAGSIRVLRDLDGDGVYEHAVVFADRLVFPTGVQPWRDGVIVTLAGRIAYMADTDGDDICDLEETWFTGFAEDNEQLRANHPTLGMDGLVYVAAGLRGGTIESTDARWSGAAKPVRLIHADFAFDPHGGYFGAVSGDSQYGLAIDDFGNRIGASNRNPAKLAVLPLSLVAHDPWLSSGDLVVDVSASGPDSSVHPIAAAWTTSNLHAGQYSAACAPHRIAASALPKSWQGNLLCCEPTGYLIQRSRVDDSAMVPISTTVLDPGEAIASRDPWFRPVDLVDGPGGCVYVVDMHRAVIEHPEWVPDELKHRVDERYGNDCGRIYRIQTSNHAYRVDLPESGEAGALVTMLDSSDVWQRSEATRLLVERGPDAVAVIRERFSSLRNAPGLSRAASLLAHFSALEIGDVEALADSSSSQLRSVAARLAVDVHSGVEVAARLVGDEVAAVRLAAVTALASTESMLDPASLESLAIASGEADQHATFVLAMGAVADANVEPLLRAILQRESPHRLEIASRLLRRAAAANPEADPFWLDVSDDDIQSLAAAWMDGVERSRRSPKKLVEEFSEANRQRWQHLVASSLAISLDQSRSSDQRVAAIRIAALGDRTELRGLRDEMTRAEVQTAVMRLFAEEDFAEHLRWLESRMAQLSWASSLAGVQLALSQPDGQRWVLDALAGGTLARGLLPPADAERLRGSSDVGVAARASKVLQAAGQDRGHVIEQYRNQLVTQADPLLGRGLFAKHCAACHVIAGEGHVVGPDISDSRTQTPDTLLVSILDPSRAIDAGFVRYSALTVGGQAFDGLLVDDRADAVTLKVSGGTFVTIPRDEIEELGARGVSLMPDGFEQLLTPAEMSNLISYLKNWRYLAGRTTP